MAQPNAVLRSSEKESCSGRNSASKRIGGQLVYIYFWIVFCIHFCILCCIHVRVYFFGSANKEGIIFFSIIRSVLSSTSRSKVCVYGTIATLISLLCCSTLPSARVVI